MPAGIRRYEGVVVARDRRHVPVVSEDDPLVLRDLVALGAPPFGSDPIPLFPVVVFEGIGRLGLTALDQDLE